MFNYKPIQLITTRYVYKNMCVYSLPTQNRVVSMLKVVKLFLVEPPYTACLKGDLI